MVEQELVRKDTRYDSNSGIATLLQRYSSSGHTAEPCLMSTSRLWCNIASYSNLYELSELRDALYNASALPFLTYSH